MCRNQKRDFTGDCGGNSSRFFVTLVLDSADVEMGMFRELWWCRAPDRRSREVENQNRSRGPASTSP